MGTVKIDSSFTDKPEVFGLSDKAFRAHITAMCWASDVVVDGTFSKKVARSRLGARPSAVRELLDAGLWVEINGGYELAGWLTTQPSKAEIEERQARDAYRKWVSRNRAEILADLTERDGGEFCQICGAVDADWHIDHITPLSKGGTNDLENLQLLCARCNLKKGSSL